MMMFRYLVTAILVLSVMFSSMAQDDAIPLVEIENTMFGIVVMVPETWSSAGPGVFMRSETDNDVATLIVQSAPLAREALLTTLLPRLGTETLPESSGMIVGEGFEWEDYVINVEAGGLDIGVSLALAQNDGITYLVILQSLAEEHGTLREAVYRPAVQSVHLPVQDVPEGIPYSAEDVSFDSGEIVLAGTITIPEGDGPFPGVVLISGSGASDRDESIAPLAEIKPFAILADYLSRNGIVVLRYDDRGVGQSGGDAVTTTLADVVQDASAAVTYLAARAEVSADAIGVIGHSEGGAVAPEVALENADVAFVIGLAAPAVDLYDVLIAQNQALFVGSDDSQDRSEEIASVFEQIRSSIRASDDGRLQAAVADLILLQTGESPSDPMLLAGVDQFRAVAATGYLDYAPADSWAQIEQPVLAIYGGKDFQVDAAMNEAALQRAAADNTRLTIAIIEDANHLFQAAETGSFTEYATLEQTIMPEVLERIVEWILDVTNSM